MDFIFFRKVSYFGTKRTNREIGEQIVLSNRVSYLSFWLTILFGIIYNAVNREDFLFIPIIVIAFLFAFPIILNHFGYPYISRLVLSCLLPTITLTLSVVGKYYGDSSQETSAYYDYKYVLLASAIIPFLYFQLNEWKWLGLSQLVILAAIVLFDPIHNFLGIGYFQSGHTDQSYTFTKVVLLFVYFFSIGCMMILKYTKLGYVKENNVLINDLRRKNSEIEQQNKEIKLRESKLNDALKTISEQKDLIHTLNIELQEELILKNTLLEDTNHELIKHNNELRQFAFAVSHNLRGPVATLLGLFNLLPKCKSKPEHDSILNRIKKTVQNLDGVITDLNKIVSIRNEVYTIREKVIFEDELEKINLLLDEELKSSGANLSIDFTDAPLVYSVKAMINSILFNLISNSIKYRYNERPLHIHIKTYVSDGYTILKVRDNGIGINLEKYKENVFEPYQRFNLDTGGKGLGLYLVKMQAEALGGAVNVESEQGEWTEFTVTVKNTKKIKDQLFFEADYASISYDAELSLNVIKWLKEPTFEEYKVVYLKAIEHMLQYKIPNWLIDYRLQGNVPISYHNWMREKVLGTIFENGLKNAVLVVKDRLTETGVLYKKMALDTFGGKDAKVYFTSSVEDAYDWLHERIK